ncbi:MAG: hypothetical protein CVT84_16050 [Alphaproteobacteria bacterium HGW-Alphaproteobacteria-6]|jgi:hypothetical protein|nr:MAG: hypothetical protein CVT84_16050 [Alphaproteobacteria bacterium HGW-Alphaproteobacteria-6]
MRILSSRVSRARRLGDGADRVEAVVTLLAIDRDGAQPRQLHLRISAAARAPGAAPLRARLLAAAKLMVATRPDLWHAASPDPGQASAA